MSRCRTVIYQKAVHAYSKYHHEQKHNESYVLVLYTELVLDITKIGGKYFTTHPWYRDIITFYSPKVK
jgi:hypothetical protein